MTPGVSYLGMMARRRKEGCGDETVVDGERYRCVGHKHGDHQWGILPSLEADAEPAQKTLDGVTA